MVTCNVNIYQKNYILQYIAPILVSHLRNAIAVLVNCSVSRSIGFVYRDFHFDARSLAAGTCSEVIVNSSEIIIII